MERRGFAAGVRLPVGGWLFLFLWSVYLFTMSGWIDSFDARLMLRVTQSIVENGSFAIPDTPDWIGLYGREGLFYSPTSLGISLTMAPFYLLGRQVAELFPDSPFSPTVFTTSTIYMIEFFVQLLNPLMMAAMGLVLFMLLRQLRYSIRVSALSTLVFALATAAWPFSKHAFATPTSVLLLLSSVLCIAVFGNSGRQKWLAIGGLAAGGAMLTYVSTAIAFPAIMVYLILVLLKRSEGKLDWKSLAVRFAVFSASLGAMMLVIAVYNWYRFGNFLETGYAVGGEQTLPLTPIYFGLHGLLFSSGRSLFLYSPPLILAAAAFPAFARRHRPEAVLLALIFLSYVLFYARVNVWHGEWSWGPRYVFGIIPFAMLPICHLLSRFRKLKSRAKKAIVPVAIGAGVFVQLLGITVPYQWFLASTPNPHERLDYLYMKEVHFLPIYSPVVGHYRILGDYLAAIGEAVKGKLGGGPQAAFGEGLHWPEPGDGRQFRRTDREAYIYIYPEKQAPRTITLTLSDNGRDDGARTEVRFFLDGRELPGPTVLMSEAWQEVQLEVPEGVGAGEREMVLKLVASTWRSEKTGWRDQGVAISSVAVDGRTAYGLANVAWSHSRYPQKVETINHSLDFWWVRVFYTDLPANLLWWAALFLGSAAFSGVRLWSSLARYRRRSVAKSAELV